MSATPLSDAMDLVRQHDNEENYARFLEVFLRSRLGIIARGLPGGVTGTMQVGQGVSCASVAHPRDGREFILACADMAAFNARFERKFNAELDAPSLMNVVMANPSSAGIFINSANSEHSVAVERSTIERLLAPSTAPPKKPWWKIW